MGGFNVANFNQNDVSDVDKRPKLSTTSGVSTTDTDIMFFVPDNSSNNDLGMWLTQDRDQNIGIDHGLNPEVTLSGTNFCDRFTKPGFWKLDLSGISDLSNHVGGSYVARENPAFSSKITSIIDSSGGKVTVADPNILKTFKDELFNKGWTIINNVFSKEEVQDLRLKAKTVESIKNLKGDILANPQIGHIVYDERIIRIVENLLGGNITYFGEGRLLIESVNGRKGGAFHRDNPDREDGKGPDWKSKYDVVRVGIYLEDHKDFSQVHLVSCYLGSDNIQMLLLPDQYQSLTLLS